MAQNSGNRRAPMAIFSVTISIHAHSSEEAKARLQEMLARGMDAPAPVEAVAAESYRDLVADIQIAEPVWCEQLISEKEAMAIPLEPEG
ncbi:hypothetical protein [Marinobacterium arenosum]|uniref:hypothetical protein n=1 Tax=Marinobacterium arenosum TaxID=2862496 RepID=UPI001C94ACE9|nr:hypothetical protein [Marinobacterium arenosum]MBY4677466.1 hypothetical protein [Marinobacterium arenosum]